MINRIEIEGYKSFKKIDLELKPINILIGANGSGKSNFLTFFEFLNELYNGNLVSYIRKKGGVDKLIHKGSKITQELSSKLTFGNTFDDNVNGYSFKLLLTDDNQLFFEKEGLGFQDDYTFINEGGVNSKLKYTEEPWRAKYIQGFMERIKKYHFHDTSTHSPFSLDYHIIKDKHFLYKEGGNLAPFLFKLKTENLKVYQRIVNVIKSIAPYFLDFFLEPEYDLLRLQWISNNSENVYDVSNLSDGTLRFIALAVLFLQPTLPQTLIIDEPELGLHPFALYKLSGLIKSAASRGCQIILATQSAKLISYFEPENILTVDQIKGATHLNRLDESSLEHWLEDYTIGELWQRSIISGGQPNE